MYVYKEIIVIIQIIGGIIVKSLIIMNKECKMEILKYIYLKQITSYKELEEHFFISRRTIFKYLNEIGEYLKPHNIYLVRKQNLGIYLKGDLSILDELLRNNDSEISLDSKSERWLYILAALISRNTPITIQRLADDLYVSRSTLENDLKIIKGYLLKYDIYMVKSKNGMKININEKQKHSLIEDIFNDLWKMIISTHDKEGYVSMKNNWVINFQEIISLETSEKTIYSLNLFFDKSFVNKEIVESVKKREGMSSTTFNNIAILYSEPQYVKESKIVVYVSRRGVDYNDARVKVIFFMALNQDIRDSVTSIYHFLADIIDNPLVMKQLINSKNAKEFIQTIK